MLPTRCVLCSVLKSGDQPNPHTARSSRRDVSVAVRIDVVPLVSQVLHVSLKTQSLGDSEEDRSISPGVTRQRHRIVDRREHLGSMDDAQAGSQSREDLIAVP